MTPRQAKAAGRAEPHRKGRAGPARAERPRCALLVLAALLSLLALARPLAAQDYPDVLVDLLGWDLVGHHYRKADVPMFSTLGGGTRQLLPCTLLEPPDSTQRLQVQPLDGPRQSVRIDHAATRVYRLDGAPAGLQDLTREAACVLVYYQAEEPVVTELLLTSPETPWEEAVPAPAATLPLQLADGTTLTPPTGWKPEDTTLLADLIPRVYRGKRIPHLFVIRPTPAPERAPARNLVLLRERPLELRGQPASERLALWTLEDKAMVIRLITSDRLTLALVCLLEDYQSSLPGYRQMVVPLLTR